MSCNIEQNFIYGLGQHSEELNCLSVMIRLRMMIEQSTKRFLYRTISGNYEKMIL